MNTMNIDNLIAAMPASGRTSKYESQLDSDVCETLESFVDWLVADGKTQATARSYKSYVAKALVQVANGTPAFTSDMKSAIRKFAEFNEQ